MSRIGRLGADQIRVLNRLTQIGKALTENTTRLSTLKRINSSKDDPAGMVKATILERELAAAEGASRSLSRASALLGTADKAAGEIITQLQAARDLIVASAVGGTPAEDIAANQIQVDSIINGIDTLSKTEFAGQQLLSGASSYRTSNLDTAEFVDVDILSKSTNSDVTINVTVDSQSSKATNSYTDGQIHDHDDDGTTIQVTGNLGTTTVDLFNHDETQDIADAFNAVSHLTGVVATRIDDDQVDFASEDYGADQTIELVTTLGDFDFTTSGPISGTDLAGTINGESFASTDPVVRYTSGDLTISVEIDPTASGTLTPFTVKGDGLNFMTGLTANSTARMGMPVLTTTSLGGVDGKLNSILSGGANTLTDSKFAEALAIVDDAIAEATRGQAIIGSFQKFTIDTSSRVVDSTTTHLSDALSAIQDTDIALETAKLTQNQLLQQSALEALSITSFKNQDILTLLARAAAR
jgi:flagellin-like hook-associated protein FlgL